MTLELVVNDDDRARYAATLGANDLTFIKSDGAGIYLSDNNPFYLSANPARTGLPESADWFEVDTATTATIGLACGSAPPSDDTIYVQSYVLANWKGYGDWLYGRVSSIDDGPLYTVLYDDGDTESGIPPERIRVTESPRAEYALREPVHAVRTSTGEDERGQVRILQANGLFTIEFEDGGVETNVGTERITPLYLYERGQSIEAQLCWWFTGQVTDITPSGKYQITFEDDGYVSNIPYQQIREILVRHSPGDRVEILVDETWHSAIIIAEEEDNTYFVGFRAAVNGQFTQHGVEVSRIRVQAND